MLRDQLVDCTVNLFIKAWIKLVAFKNWVEELKRGKYLENNYIVNICETRKMAFP